MYYLFLNKGVSFLSCFILIIYASMSLAVDEVVYEPKPLSTQHTAAELFNQIIPQGVFDYEILPKLKLEDLENLSQVGKIPFLEKYNTAKLLIFKMYGSFHPFDDKNLINAIKKYDFDKIVKDLISNSTQNKNPLVKRFRSIMTAFGVITESIIGINPSIVLPNSFDRNSPLAKTKGLVKGLFKQAIVTNNAILGYDVKVAVGTTYCDQIFTATGITPTNGGILSLHDVNSNALQLKYANSVSGITSATTFKMALETLLGLYQGGWPVYVKSNSEDLDPVNGIASVIATETIPSGYYVVIYESNNNLLSINDERGKRIYKACAYPYKGQSITFPNGIVVTFGSEFVNRDYQLFFEANNI